MNYVIIFREEKDGDDDEVDDHAHVAVDGEWIVLFNCGDLGKSLSCTIVVCI